MKDVLVGRNFLLLGVSVFDIEYSLDVSDAETALGNGVVEIKLDLAKDSKCPRCWLHQVPPSQQLCNVLSISFSFSPLFSFHHLVDIQQKRSHQVVSNRDAQRPSKSWTFINKHGGKTAITTQKVAQNSQKKEKDREKKRDRSEGLLMHCDFLCDQGRRKTAPGTRKEEDCAEIKEIVRLLREEGLNKEQKTGQDLEFKHSFSPTTFTCHRFCFLS